MYKVTGSSKCIYQERKWIEIISSVENSAGKTPAPYEVINAEKWFGSTISVLQHRMVSIPISWRRLRVSSGQFFDDKFSGLGCGIEPIC
jgi:hypothetical protein